MVAVAQLVRAPDCGSGGCGFNSRQPPSNSLQRTPPMRIVLRSLAVVTLATTPAALVAQNSVSSALRDAATYNAKNLVAAAQAMPAANYAFKPTPKQWS